MGKLNIPNQNRGNFKNRGAVKWLVDYISRNNRYGVEDLIDFGGAGIISFLEIQDIIKEMRCVQDANNIRVRNGRRMYHEYFTISDEEFPGLRYQQDILKKFARDCCQVYYDMGFQVVYAIHGSEKVKLHIHFAVNTISYVNGKKWNSFFTSLRERECHFNCILDKYKHIQYPFVRMN